MAPMIYPMTWGLEVPCLLILGSLKEVGSALVSHLITLEEMLAGKGSALEFCFCLLGVWSWNNSTNLLKESTQCPLDCLLCLLCHGMTTREN